MNAITRAQARAFDQVAIERLGIPSLVLMENAGRGAAEVMQSLGIHGPVLICCGKGNNGGDGLVIARHLANAGCKVSILLLVSPASLSPDAGTQWNIVQKMHLYSEVWPDLFVDENNLASNLARTDWIVDALFGTGLTGPVRAPFDRLIGLMNSSGAKILAVDIPSGLDADTGEPLGATVRAAHTVTFVAPKAGFANPTAATFTGQVHVANIGIAPIFVY